MCDWKDRVTTPAVVMNSSKCHTVNFAAWTCVIKCETLFEKGCRYHLNQEISTPQPQTLPTSLHFQPYHHGKKSCWVVWLRDSTLDAQFKMVHRRDHLTATKHWIFSANKHSPNLATPTRALCLLYISKQIKSPLLPRQWFLPRFQFLRVWAAIEGRAASHWPPQWARLAQR